MNAKIALYESALRRLANDPYLAADANADFAAHVLTAASLLDRPGLTESTALCPIEDCDMCQYVRQMALLEDK